MSVGTPRRARSNMSTATQPGDLRRQEDPGTVDHRGRTGLHGRNSGTIGALLDDWLRDGRQGRAATTLDGYRTNIESTIRHAATFPSVVLAFALDLEHQGDRCGPSKSSVGWWPGDPE